MSITVPFTMSAFGSQLILSAVARFGITIIGDDVQLGVGPSLLMADSWVLLFFALCSSW
jgi:hypothetical protein